MRILCEHNEAPRNSGVGTNNYPRIHHFENKRTNFVLRLPNYRITELLFVNTNKYELDR